MADETKKDSGWISWALIVFLFAVGLAPIALILLLWKLFKNDKKKTLPEGESRTAKSVEAKAVGKARSAVSAVTRTPVPKRSNAKGLKIGGGVLAAVGLIACAEPIDMMIWLGEIEHYYVEDLLVALAMVAGGAAMLCSGISMSRSLKRYSKYLAVMGDRDAVKVEELARTLGYPSRRVEKDLGKMIDKGYFGGKAYLHAELGYLLRSPDGAGELLRQQAQQKPAEPPEETETGYSGILWNIRRANDRIADPVLSAKIDRIEELTGRIFQAVDADPKKRERIDTFLNYYLPTTQKLLDSYAQFEQAGVEGENLRQAKQRIETTMDTIVGGFEHQLDELYRSDALDVDSDIRVLETMLRWETASTARDFGMDQTGKP